MPIDIRFSKKSFTAESERDRSAKKLANALEAEIQQELHEVIMPKIVEVVKRLNATGHQLSEYTPPVPGDISFRDDEEKNGSYTCFLRLGVDTVISVGFKDAIVENGESDQRAGQ
jgi:hypothetical protein